MEFLIKPRFSALRSAVYFETDKLNALLEQEYNDKFGFYQSNFGVYNYMPMTRNMTYRMVYPEGTPLLFQPHNSCAWTPTGTLSYGVDEISPCKAKINEQRCYDENLDGLFADLLRWGGGPTVQMSDAGRAANDALVRTMLKNATLGARLTLSCGQLHDPDVVTFEDGISARIEDAFRKTAQTCKGWIQLLKERASETGLGHLDGGYIDATDISTDGTSYVGTTSGDAVALYDEIFAAAPQPLTDAVIEGGYGGFGSMFMPLFLVSPSIYRAVDAAWKAQKETATMNEPRISRRPYTFQTERGPRTLYTYFIDDTAVVPISEVSYFDRYVTGTSHFAYLTVSGVIQLGASFGSLPVVNEADIAVMIQLSENAEDYGTYKFLAHSLFATAINDTDYIAGDYLYAEPA